MIKCTKYLNNVKSLILYYNKTQRYMKKMRKKIEAIIDFYIAYTWMRFYFPSKIK